MADSKETTTAQRLLHAFMRTRRPLWLHSAVGGLRPSDAMALFCIKRSVAEDSSGIRVSELGGMLNISGPTMTQQLNDLTARGLVEKEVDPEDRRGILVRLTDSGLVTVHSMGEGLLSSFEGLAEYLGEKDSEKLVELLNRALTYFDENKNKGAAEG